jgi:hypothetical protein
VFLRNIFHVWDRTVRVSKKKVEARGKLDAHFLLGSVLYPEDSDMLFLDTGLGESLQKTLLNLFHILPSDISKWNPKCAYFFTCKYYPTAWFPIMKMTSYFSIP